jgi:hydrogenase expression/formation protein HypC
MSRLDEQEAARTLALLHELGVAQGEMAEMRDQTYERPNDKLPDQPRDDLRRSP